MARRREISASSRSQAATNRSVGSAPICGAVGDAVHVLHELVHARAELVQVQVGIAGNERIEGPVHDADAQRLAFRALPGLELRAHAGAAQFGNDRQHVAPVGELAVANAGEAENEADEATVGGKGAGGDPADLRAHLQDGRRHALAEPLAPRGFLQRHALNAVLVGDEVPNEQWRARRGGGSIHILNLMRNLPLHQRRRAATALGIVTFLAVPALGAQETAPTAPRHPRRPPVMAWHDARLLGAFTLAAAVVMPADRAAQRAMQRDQVQRSSFYSHAADAFNAYGSPRCLRWVGSVLRHRMGHGASRRRPAGPSHGRGHHAERDRDGGIKGIAGRARPYKSPQRPGDWRLFSASATARGNRFRRGTPRRRLPLPRRWTVSCACRTQGTARWAGPALYGAAALTGLARMHSDNHWASDVVMGAGVGIMSGLVVARFHAGRPQHWIDRRLLPRTRQ